MNNMGVPDMTLSVRTTCMTMLLHLQHKSIAQVYLGTFENTHKEFAIHKYCIKFTSRTA